MSKMPVLFVGHGSPMNAIEENEYTRGWKIIAGNIPKPKAILSVSAHWYVSGTKILNDKAPKMVYDMYGFPDELYEVKYSPQGAPEVAQLSKALITTQSRFDNSWGIDHGTWSVLVHMYPKADISVFQISVDAGASPAIHYQIGKDLKSLRQQGVLIFGTGNVVHNLRLVDWNMPGAGFDWAHEFDDYIYENIQSGNHDKILNYKELGDLARLAVPTPDHFIPLLYVLGATDKDDKVSVFNKSGELGSLSMTSYLFG